jgi:D-lactate dehydrogenase
LPCLDTFFCPFNLACRDITLTPRQRIAVYKELFRLRAIENRDAAQQQRLDEMAKIFEYDGQDTCAAGGC